MNVVAIPDRIFTIPILVRGVLLWASTRAVLALVPRLMTGFEEPFSLEVTNGAAAWIIGVVAALGLVEMRRRNEHLLLANLGIREATLGVIAALPALLGEVVIAFVVPDGAPRS